MAERKHLSAPLPTTKMPPSVPYILTNEAAERFAFYGMSSILVVFMTQNLLGPGGVLSPMADESARAWFHLFTAAVYFMAIVGALISDLWFGKFKTIIWFCAGVLRRLLHLDARPHAAGSDRGADPDRHGLGHHQALRLRQRRRPVRALQQAPDPESL